MDLLATQGVALRFQAYIEYLSGVVGHADRREPLATYCTGLLLPGERKSVEPMAARIAPEAVGAKHQSLHHFVAKIGKNAPIRAWIIDDTGIPKKGKHSVGVARQMRVRPSHRDYWRGEPWPQEWLLIEWPEGEKEPEKYWLSTLPADIPISTRVDTAKLRSERLS